MEEHINYLAFRKIGDSLPLAWRGFFLPSVFIKFPRDRFGSIPIRPFFRYVRSKVRFTRLRISLSCFDDLGQGSLREHDLENYVFEQIPLMPMLADLKKDFYPYYVFTAVRKFVFFLDPMKKGKIKIKDMVYSSHLQEFNKLRMPLPAGGVLQGKRKKSEWFSSRSTLQVYSAYLNLDTDRNGMLNKQEFSRYNGGVLTQPFVDGLFQQYRMYSLNDKDAGEMEMDYKTFLDFVLAMDNKHTPESIRYFFKILDIDGVGYLTLHTLHYFFRAVVKRMQELGHEPVDSIEVVSNEIVDMINPSDPNRITIADLIKSNYAATVISMLIDVNGFWRYENREVLPKDDDEEE
jgi:Ca2+-binding EF-hand superfamily protein